MQGQLRSGEELTFDILTECGHCGRPLKFEMNGAMEYRFAEEGVRPLVFSPDVDWSQLKDPNIIDAY